MNVSPLEVEIPEHMMRDGIDREKFADLKKSMEAEDLINPITVRKVGDKLELVAGYRRLKAAKELRWKKIEVSVVKADDARAERLKIAENNEREEVSPIDEGKYLNGLMVKLGLNQAQLAEVIGKSEGYISQRLGTIKWPNMLKDAVLAELVTFSGGREIMGIRDPRYREGCIIQALEHGASLKVIRVWVDQYNRMSKREEERLGEGPIIEAHKGEFRSELQCEACGLKDNPGNFNHIMVDDTCKALMNEVQFKSMMQNSGAAVREAAQRAKTLGAVVEEEEKREKGAAQ